MATLTAGEAIVHALLANGVDTLFGLPGVQSDYLFNALYDQGDKIRVIHTRHEQGSAYMALGYALTTDKVGVYSVVPGPGFLNTTAALATAYGRSARVLCLSSQIQSDHMGRGFGMLHEIPDQLAIMRGLTKWAESIRAPGEAPALVTEAFRQLYSGRPRPVGLECPMDVLSAKQEIDLPAVPYTARHPTVDVDATETAAKLLGGAKSPVIFIGGGAVDAGSELLELAEALQAPIIASYNARGVVSNRHYLSHSLPAGHSLWADTDVVLAVGTRLQAPLLNWGIDDDLRIIRVDVDPQEHDRISPPEVSIIARSQDVLQALIPAVGRHNSVRGSRRQEMNALKTAMESKYAELVPQMDFINVIREELPDDGFYVDELTQVGYVSRFAMPFYLPRTCVSPGYQGTLGWGFATALGVKVANPDKAVLAVSGDGGFLFTAQELATAVQQQINTVTLVFNDGAYGNVRRMQKERYDSRIIASELHNPDIVKYAEAFGAQGLRARTPQEVRRAIRRGFATRGPTLVDIPVGEMPSPWSFAFAPRVRPRSQ